MSSVRWVDPSPVGGGDGVDALTPEQRAAWREQGFVLVDGLLPAELLARARHDAAAAFPPPGSPESEAIHDFGSMGRMVFPI